MRTRQYPRRPARAVTLQTTCLALIGFQVGFLSSNTAAQIPPQNAPARGGESGARPAAPSDADSPHASTRLIDAEGMITARPGALLRTAPNARFYPIVIIETPQRLEVVDPIPRKGFVRVALPPETSALVSAEACEAVDDRSVRVTRPTRLIALHARSGPEASWKSLLDNPLRPGSRLEVVDVVRDRMGGIQAYLVAAPSDASAWIAVDQIVPLPEPKPVEQTQGDVPEAEPARENDTPEAGDIPDVGSENAGTRRTATDEPVEAGSNLMEAMVPPGAEAPGGVEPAPSNLATNAPAALIEQGSSDTPSAEQEALDPAELEAVYQRARQSDTFEDELEALLAEHRRTLASLPNDPFNERLRRQLERRIAYLEARIAFRDGPERLAAQRAAMPRISEQLREKLERLRAGNEFQLIGRLVVSRVYDGKRLPRLYRVRSADALGRTLGYVRPQEGQDMTPYLDHIVGVAGSVEEGPVGSRIVIPSRVEILDETP